MTDIHRMIWLIHENKCVYMRTVYIYIYKHYNIQVYEVYPSIYIIYHDITSVHPTFNPPCPCDTRKGMDWRQRVKKSNLVRSQAICLFGSSWWHSQNESPFRSRNLQEIYSLTFWNSCFFLLVDSRTGWNAGKPHPSHVWLVTVRVKRPARLKLWMVWWVSQGP